MPAGDGTGPMGMGPMTGRAAGYCAGYRIPGYNNPITGRGFGWGLGGGRGFWGGRGWRRRYYATGLPGWIRFGGYTAPYAYPGAYYKPDPEMEKQALKNQANALQSELDAVNKRLGELGAEETAG